VSDVRKKGDGFQLLHPNETGALINYTRSIKKHTHTTQPRVARHSTVADSKRELVDSHGRWKRLPFKGTAEKRKWAAASHLGKRFEYEKPKNRLVDDVQPLVRAGVGGFRRVLGCQRDTRGDDANQDQVLEPRAVDYLLDSTPNFAVSCASKRTPPVGCRMSVHFVL
jgi:hypothetical protein